MSTRPNLNVVGYLKLAHEATLRDDVRNGFHMISAAVFANLREKDENKRSLQAKAIARFKALPIFNDSWATMQDIRVGLMFIKERNAPIPRSSHKFFRQAAISGKTIEKGALTGLIQKQADRVLKEIESLEEDTFFVEKMSNSGDLEVDFNKLNGLLREFYLIGGNKDIRYMNFKLEVLNARVTNIPLSQKIYQYIKAAMFNQKSILIVEGTEQYDWIETLKLRIPGQYVVTPVVNGQTMAKGFLIKPF